MEHTWIAFSLAGMIALGLGDFIKKLVLEKGANKEVFLMTCFLFYVPLFWGNMLLQGDRNFTPELVEPAMIIGIFNFFIPLCVLTALKYLNVSFALVSIRITSSFIILLVGVFLLGDNLSFWNYIGFFMGGFAIFLLSGFSFQQKNILPLKGIIAVIIAVIGIVISNSYFKYVVPDVNIPDFMVVQFTTTSIALFLYMIIRKKFVYFTKTEFGKVLPYAIATCVIFFLHFLYFLPNIYILGPLSLGYKMLSYSLIVPILLSIIFLGEPVTKRRIVAFILTLISIFLFLV